MTDAKSDPLYKDLMTPATGQNDDLPLHNYYSEFRLGQGDPLMKASMGQWPYTTTDEDRQPKVPSPKLDCGKKCTAVGFPACSTVAAPNRTTSSLLFNDVVHIENNCLVEEE